MRAAVHEDLTPDVRAAFVDDHDELRRLHDRPRVRCGVRARHAGRQAARFGIVLAEVFLAFLVECFGRRQHRHIDTGADHVHVLANRVRLPVA